MSMTTGYGENWGEYRRWADGEIPKPSYDPEVNPTPINTKEIERQREVVDKTVGAAAIEGTPDQA